MLEDFFDGKIDAEGRRLQAPFTLVNELTRETKLKLQRHLEVFSCFCCTSNLSCSETAKPRSRTQSIRQSPTARYYSRCCVVITVVFEGAQEARAGCCLQRVAHIAFWMMWPLEAPSICLEMLPGDYVIK